MSVLRTSNGTWTYDFEYRGKRYRKRFKSQKLASIGEAEKKLELSRNFIRNEKITFREASQLFFEKHSKVTKNSWKTDLSQIKVLNELFGNKRLIDFTPLDIQDMRTYLEQKGLKSGSVDHYHILVKTIFNKMSSWRIHDGYNPANGVKLKREPDVHLRFLNKQEVMLLEELLPKSIYPYFIGALHTGMRRGELCNLRWENVTLALKDIYVSKSKSGRARHIPVNDTLYEVLLNLWGDGEKPTDFVFGTLSFHYITHKFGKVCRKLDIKNARWHDLRHTFASQLVMSGVNLYVVSKWLGHSSVVITEKYYAHLAPDFQKEEIQKLNKLTNMSLVNARSSKSRQTFDVTRDTEEPTLKDTSSVKI